jgi:hypothetical protein
MPQHRWSGWPGAWCLDCGCEDPHEIALADGEFFQITDPNEPMGFRYEFPLVTPEMLECKEPGSNRCNPYEEGKKAHG